VFAISDKRRCSNNAALAAANLKLALGIATPNDPRVSKGTERHTDDNADVNCAERVHIPTCEISGRMDH
jgi:hypothetical protein